MTEKIQTLLENIFPESKSINFERVPEGNTTEVYRVVVNDVFVYYLRIQQNTEENMSSEALVHQMLRKQAIRVAEVVYCKDFDESFDGRSLMITKELPGKAFNKQTDLSEQQKLDIIFEAGSELALINRNLVEGFGLNRTIANVKDLQGNGKSYTAKLTWDLEQNLKLLVDHKALDKTQCDLIEKLADKADDYLDNPIEPHLAHGDFDFNHIFVHDGRFSGIIDFGDIDGAGLLHDLAMFRAHYPDYFPELLSGFRTVVEMPDRLNNRLAYTTVFISVQKLAWHCKNMPEKVANHPYLKALNEDLGIIKA